MRTYLHRYGQPFAEDTNWRCLQEYRRQQTFVRHKRLSKRSSASQRRKQKGLGQGERRDKRNANECVCLRPKVCSILAETKKNIKKSKGTKKYVVKKEIRHAPSYNEALFFKKPTGTKWTCFSVKGMKFMGCVWTKPRWGHLIQSDTSQKTERRHICVLIPSDTRGAWCLRSFWGYFAARGHNQQFLAHKASLGSIVHVVENRFFGSSDRSFSVVYFQRPDRICGSFPPAFLLIRLVEISYVDKLFFSLPRLACDKE